MTSASDLFALQEIDLKRDARRAIMADIDSRLGETDALVEAREDVEDASAAVERLRRRQKEIEMKLQDLDAKLKPLEKRLYDGSVRNPKELTDLQHELDSLKAARSKLDDQGLEIIESFDGASRALREAQRILTDTEAQWKSEQEALAADKAKAEAEMANFDGQRAVFTKAMDPFALGLYEKLRGTRQGRAVARMERGTCLGCRISLPTHLIREVRTADRLVQCPSCERILVAG